jgi:hypothetical protein
MAERVTELTPPKTDERGARRPYTTPVLRVFGTVAAMTENLSKDAGGMDGGANNTKT